MQTESRILWPPNYDPTNCPIHVRNQLEIPGPPETVWAWLIRAQLWPKWYPNSANILFLSGKPPDLASGTRFRWKTFGVTVESTVLEFMPFERLGWDARRSGFDAYHAWLIQKNERGCYVLTEEVQRGSLARLSRILRPSHMEEKHQLWLERLSAQAIGGLPPPP